MRQAQLLDARHLEEAAALGLQFADLKAFADEIVRRGWLTKWQRDQIGDGRAHELVLEPYLLLSPLGEGGMGHVFKARQRRLKRLAALKVMRKECLKSSLAIQRFLQEAEAAAALNHANIVQVYDANEVNGIPFLAMEYLEGSDLSKLVRTSGPLPVAEACEHIRQTALGLQHAHERGLVHRDIKPSNLMLTTAGVVKILDMGLARLSHSMATDDHGVSLTATGQTLGTPDFLAPEQALNAKSADIRADIYSLGCSLYYLLTGRTPFTGESVTEKLLKHQMEEAPALDGIRPHLPPHLAVVVRKMMAKRPENRYQTPNEVVSALQPFAGPTSAGYIPQGSLACVANVGQQTPAHDETPPQRSDKAAGGQAKETSVEIDPPGICWSRPTGDVEAEWREVARTPGALLLLPGHEYRLDVAKDATNLQLSGLANVPLLAVVLSHLHLRECQFITDLGLGHLQGLTALRHLDLGFCKQITDKGLVKLQRLVALQHLDLSFCEHISDAGLVCLQELKLKELKLSNHRITDMGLATVGRLSSLQSLSLWSCSRITDEGVKNLRSLKSLRHLDLAECTKVTDAGLDHVGSLASLQYLDLQECQQITDAGLAHLKNASSLQRLDLRECDSITDAGLAHLRGLVSLRHVAFSGNNKITDEGLAHLQQLTALQHLDLYSSRQITDVGLSYLQSLSNLQYLGLYSCRHVTDEGLAYLRGLTALRQLVLRWCLNITDAGVFHLHPLMSLQQLDLRECKQITDKGLAHFHDLLALKRLDLRGCTRISKSGVALLKMSLPQCQIKYDEKAS